MYISLLLGFWKLSNHKVHALPNFQSSKVASIMMLVPCKQLFSKAGDIIMQKPSSKHNQSETGI